MTVHLPRLRTLAIPMLFAATTLMVAAGHAQAADIPPVGIGDLMPSPASSVPKGQGTLYEEYSNPSLWLLDTDYGVSDALEATSHTIADLCMVLIVVLGRACVTIVQWIFQFVSLPELQGVLTGSISGAAKYVSATLLPAALAVGGLVAFARHRDGGGGGLSQIAWLFVSGLVSVSLLSTPQVWVDGVDTTRQVGANVALSATADGIGTGEQTFPFKLDHQPQYTGSGRDDMLRKSSDAVWRSYVATPWCLAEFGSFEVCEKYGKELLDQGPSADKRKDWLKETVDRDAVGGASVEWRQGHNPAGRIAITVAGLVCVAIFAVLVIALAFASLASLLGALMLLVAGSVFACLWVIPGRPRQWGLRWFDQLLGLTLQSFVATMVLGCVLVVQVATTTMFGTYGWAPSVGLSIAAALMAFKFRKIIESIVGVSGSMSPVGAAMGLLAARSATRMLKGGPARYQHNMAPKTLTKPSTRVATRGGIGGAGGVGGSGGGGGGGGGPFPAGGPDDAGGITITRVPFRHAAPPPLTPHPADDTPRSIPGAAPRFLPGPATPTRPAGDTLTATLERTDRPTPTPPRALDPAPERGAPKRPTPIRPIPKPSGVRRGAAGDEPDFIGPHGPVYRPRLAEPDYRQAPPPGAPGPKVIEARVLRSTPNPPPPRPDAPRATQPPPPARTTAPAHRSADVPKPRTQGEG
ncbi:hypothetical protein ACFVP0_24225 [Streptomyces cinereoruber]|uniref:hypothetical protein n=1 Tax=Streptomyces cinereoruber TaxID=67260 RepID=UPI0036C38BBE